MNILNYFYMPHVACQQRYERDKYNPWGFTAMHFEEISNLFSSYQNLAFLAVMDAASFRITQVKVAHAGINWGLLRIESLISCGSKAANTEFPFLFPLIHQSTFTDIRLQPRS